MELHKNTAEFFINYLKRHGYPDESIVLEWGNNKCAFDIAVVAEDCVTPVALFEIKGQKTPKSVTMGIQQMRRAYKMLKISVPCSLVFGITNEPYFEVVDVSNYMCNEDAIDVTSIMEPHHLTKPISYRNIQAGASSKIIAKKVEEKRERLDKLHPICWILFPLLAIALLVLDALDIYVLSTLRLVVIGATVIIVLLPFFSEITIKDFSFIRKKSEK